MPFVQASILLSLRSKHECQKEIPGSDQVSPVVINLSSTSTVLGRFLEASNTPGHSFQSVWEASYFLTRQACMQNLSTPMQYCCAAVTAITEPQVHEDLGWWGFRPLLNYTDHVARCTEHAAVALETCPVSESRTETDSIVLGFHGSFTQSSKSFQR